MKISVETFEKSDRLVAALKKGLGLAEKHRVRVGRDSVISLNELARLLMNLHPHKKSFATLGPLPTPVAEVALGMQREGYVLQELPVRLMPSTTEGPALVSLSEALVALKKDTLFVLVCIEEPFSGFIYPYEAIRDELSKRGIFSIAYFSPDALSVMSCVPKTPHELFVVDPCFGETSCLALEILGERFFGDDFLWGKSVLTAEGLRNLSEGVKRGVQARVPAGGLSTIAEFEAKVASAISQTHLLPRDAARTLDRAVFAFDGAHGEALSHRLREAGVQEVSTMALCAWERPFAFKWLEQLGLGPAFTESSLIIAGEFSDPKKNAELISILSSAVSDLRRISGSIL
jgi:hypothetical protein